MEITDISGKVVYNATVYFKDKATFKPDIFLKKGVYFVIIKNTGITKKFIVQ